MRKWLLPMTAAALAATPAAAQTGTPGGTVAPPAAQPAQQNPSQFQNPAQPRFQNQPQPQLQGQPQFQGQPQVQGQPQAQGQTPTQAQDQPRGRVVPVTPSDFLVVAGSGGMFELVSSRLAESRSNSDAVKKLARQMIDDHTKANQQLAAILARRGQGVSDVLSVPHSAMVRQLDQCPKDKFDHCYVLGQVAAHAEAVAVFEAFAENGQDRELAEFARQQVPALRHHLEMAVSAGRDVMGGRSGDAHGGHGDAGRGTTGTDRGTGAADRNDRGTTDRNNSGTGTTNRPATDPNTGGADRDRNNNNTDRDRNNTER